MESDFALNNGRLNARGEGWGGSLHDLADGLAEWELGAEDAVAVLLTWLEFV